MNELSKRLPQVWQLARGLPARIPKGAVLARTRRLMAIQTMTAEPSITSITEFDSSGRVVFMVPYESQLRLTHFNVCKDLWPDGCTSGLGGRGVIIHKPLISDRDGLALSFAATIKRRDTTHYLLVTVNRRFGPSPLDFGFGLVDNAGRLAAYFGDEDRAMMAPENRQELPQHIAAGYGHFMIASATSSAPLADRFVAFALASLVGQSLLVIFLNPLMFRLLSWIRRLQWGHDHARQHVQRKVQDLAHDFQNRILTLRTLMGNLTGRLTLDQLQRLSGTISDLSAYTDYLSGELVRDAFALSGSAGKILDVNTSAGTYLRGNLEMVAQQQSSVFGHRISITFSPEFDGREPFVEVGRTALTRIVSNLLRNSIDACSQAGTHHIAMEVDLDGSFAQIDVVDDGCGIAPEDHQQIFELGFSTKGQGRGQGLSGCVELARQSSGSVELIKSAPGAGARFRLRFPVRSTPPWFLKEIVLTDSSVLVIVDDEGDVYDYWNKTITERLDGITLPLNRRPQLISVSGPAEFKEKQDQLLEAGTIFLVDYRFKGENTTGVDLIEEFDLSRRAVLVTNHFEQWEVMEAVGRLGLRMLPKTYMLNAKFPLDIGGENAGLHR